MYGIPYSLLFLISFVMLLCIYPIPGICHNFSKDKNKLFFAILGIFLLQLGCASAKLYKFKQGEYKESIVREYNMCINWKNQMEIIRNRCKYKTKNNCKDDFEKMKKKFSERKEKISLYSNQELLTIKNLPELHNNLQVCATEIESMILDI